MKRKRETSLKSSQQMEATPNSYLPDECWEHVFKFLNYNDDNTNHRYFESLSVISKQLLSITNRLRSSMAICIQTRPFLPHLFKRFTNLSSLDLTRFRGDLDALLCQISTFPLSLTSLNLSNQSKIPENGLRNFSKKITTLKSLTCSKMRSINSTDIFLIADCFPLLEELDFNYPSKIKYLYNESKTFSFPLLKLRKVNLSGHYYINDQYLFSLFKKCEFLEEVIMFSCYHITYKGIASALRLRTALRSLSFFNSEGTLVDYNFIESLVSLKGLTCLDLSNLDISDQFFFSIGREFLPLRRLILRNCTGYGYVGIFYLLSKCRRIQHLDLQRADFLNDDRVAELSLFLHDLVSINLSECSFITMLALFELAKNCLSLSEIKIGATKEVWGNSYENSKSSLDCVVNHPLKSLSLACNEGMRYENYIMFASIFPNLQLLDLRLCIDISEEGICQLLRRCCKMRDLNLAYCRGLTLHEMNFEVPKLEVLNLSNTSVDDKTLYAISKGCCGLLQLLLEDCDYITEKGVKCVVENCTQLREINLRFCDKVQANVVDWMVFSRPSLRKIIAPPSFQMSDKKRKQFLSQGCLVCKQSNSVLSKFEI